MKTWETLIKSAPCCQRHTGDGRHREQIRYDCSLDEGHNTPVRLQTPKYDQIFAKAIWSIEHHHRGRPAQPFRGRPRRLSIVRDQEDDADLQEYIRFNEEFVTWALGQTKAGKTVDQASAEYKLPDQYKGYAIIEAIGGVKANVQALYDEAGNSKTSR